jgi:hypothetical protein
MPDHHESAPVGSSPRDLRARLYRSGWSITERAFTRPNDDLAWIVEGRNGDHRLRTEGATVHEAWWRAVEAAAAFGMLRDWPRPESRSAPGDAGGR